MACRLFGDTEFEYANADGFVQLPAITPINV